MGFLIPGFLAGVILAGIPFLVHLMYRRRAPQVAFAATRFLKVAAKRTSRRRKIDNLLLLVVRALLVALLALGLAGPVIKRAAGLGRGGSDVIIVIDNSLSMSAIEDGLPRFTRAKEAADMALSRLEPGDFAALVATAPPEARETPDLAGDTGAVRARLARMSVSSARGSLAAAIERAAGALSRSAAPGKLLYVVTDLQANAFPAKESLSDEARAALATVPVIVYDCGRGAARNLSVDSVSLHTQGGISGTPVEVTARVSSSSPVEETVTLVLSAGAARVQSRSVTLPAGASADVRMTLVAGAPGILDGSVALEASDAVAADNRRYFSLVVRERIKALILEKEASPDIFSDDAFFLRRALDPFSASLPSGGAMAKSPFDVTLKTYADAGEVSGYDAVYLLLRPGLPARLEKSLLDYASSGGSLVVFACDDASASSASAQAAVAEILPARLIGIRSADTGATGAAGGAGSFSIASLDIESSALAVFKDEPPALYNSTLVYNYWMAEPREGARVLARYDTGDAFIVRIPSARAGGGSVVLFTLAPTRAMSTIAASPFFLPLVYEISYDLAKASGGPGDVLACEPVAFPDGSGAVVTSPGGASTLVSASDAPSPSPVPPPSPVYRDTLRLGCYRVAASAGAAPLRAFCVNADPAESNLRRLDAKGVRSRAAGGTVLIASDRATLAESLARLKPVLAVGDVILYAVLALGLFECFVAGRITSRKTR